MDISRLLPEPRKFRTFCVLAGAQNLMATGGSMLGDPYVVRLC